MRLTAFEGYGGFSISIGPFFSPSILTAMHAYGFVLAVPNIRGGGEFGEEWHLAGTRERKVRRFNAWEIWQSKTHIDQGKLLRRLHRGFVSFSRLRET
jgi:Prolyl oligopeptidase family